MKPIILWAALIACAAQPASAQWQSYVFCVSEQTCADQGMVADPNDCTRCVASQDHVSTGTVGATGSGSLAPRQIAPIRPSVRQDRPPRANLRLRNAPTVGNLAVTPLPPAEPTATAARERCGVIAADGVVSQSERTEWDELNCVQYAAR